MANKGQSPIVSAEAVCERQRKAAEQLSIARADAEMGATPEAVAALIEAEQEFTASEWALCHWHREAEGR